MFGDYGAETTTYGGAGRGMDRIRKHCSGGCFGSSRQAQPGVLRGEGGCGELMSCRP